jgi:hypothetical protein
MPVRRKKTVIRNNFTGALPAVDDRIFEKA